MKKMILCLLSLLVVAMFLVGCAKSSEEGLAGQAISAPKEKIIDCVDSGKSITVTSTSGKPTQVPGEFDKKTKISDDKCYGQSLQDYYCDGINPKSKKTVCPNGCKDGACVQEAQKPSEPTKTSSISK